MFLTSAPLGKPVLCLSGPLVVFCVFYVLTCLNPLRRLPSFAFPKRHSFCSSWLLADASARWPIFLGALCPNLVLFLSCGFQIFGQSIFRLPFVPVPRAFPLFALPSLGMCFFALLGLFVFIRIGLRFGLRMFLSFLASVLPFGPFLVKFFLHPLRPFLLGLFPWSRTVEAVMACPRISLWALIRCENLRLLILCILVMTPRLLGRRWGSLPCLYLRKTTLVLPSLPFSCLVFSLEVAIFLLGLMICLSPIDSLDLRLCCFFHCLSFA